MKSKRPAYWQLDLLMIAVMLLMVLLMQMQLSAAYEVTAEVVWSFLTIGGMSLWVRANWAALRREECERPQRTPYLSTTNGWRAPLATDSLNEAVRPPSVHVLGATPHDDQESHDTKQQGV